MIKAVAVATLVLAFATSNGCNSGSHRGANPVNQTVCADIHAAVRAGELDEATHAAQIKSDGHQSGVATDVTHAVDAYYAHKGTAKQLLQACTDAGVPQ